MPLSPFLSLPNWGGEGPGHKLWRKSEVPLRLLERAKFPP